LWETFNQQELKGAPAITGSMVNLFDPKKYITGPSKRNAKWRVNFNGLGSMDYCVTVERTERINSLLELNILQKANEFLSELGPTASDRAMSWAYLSETKSSFEKSLLFSKTMRNNTAKTDSFVKTPIKKTAPSSNSERRNTA
jgi:hypothetical protein